MLMLVGIFSFILFFAGDVNDITLKSRVLKFCFPFGCAGLAAATVWESFNNEPNYIMLLPAAFFFLLLIYTLFFSFSSDEAYGYAKKERYVFRKGMYALCRHPGVLWFAGAYICLWAGGFISLLSAAVYIVLNILLVLFEDTAVFPVLLKGYDDYKKETPFLIPDGRSIKAALESIKKV